LAVLKDGARATYHFSGATSYGQGMGIHLYGTEGALFYDLLDDRIRGGNKRVGEKAGGLEEIPISPDQARSWRVEADFVDAIRLGTPVTLTDFATGVAYMEFTEAVARSAEEGTAALLPLEI
jgi:predicted dehydrogenase